MGSRGIILIEKKEAAFGFAYARVPTVFLTFIIVFPNSTFSPTPRPTGVIEIRELVEASFGYVIISILMDGFEFNYILFLFQGLDFYLGMEG